MKCKKLAYNAIKKLFFNVLKNNNIFPDHKLRCNICRKLHLTEKYAIK